MSFFSICKSLLLDPHPERDESHSRTRAAITSAPLYEPELPLVDTPAQDTLDQKFAAYCKEHPDYFDAIQITAWDMIRDGFTYLSMRDIIGVLRRQGININNSFTSRYTDALIEREPEMERYFHRRARAAGKTKRVYVRAH